MTDVAVRIDVRVRYFAAACSAAGIEQELVTVRAGTTVAELADLLAGRSAELAHVLRRCSYLCDGITVSDRLAELSEGQTIDILPPFAGG